MALSDLTVRQARTTGKRYTLSDNDCLGLMVSAAGGKSWMFRYYWLGKQKRMSLGGYPALSLREARTERDKAQALLARGIDPQIERDQRRQAAKLAGEYTFKNVFDAWVEHRRKELKEGRQSTLSQILRIFNKDVLPTLGKMSIYDIRRPQLVGVVAAIAVTDDHTDQLVTIIELKSRADAAELDGLKNDVVAAISRAHGLQVADVVLVEAGSIPTTTSGKMRRSACAEQYRQGVSHADNKPLSP